MHKKLPYLQQIFLINSVISVTDTIIDYRKAFLFELKAIQVFSVSEDFPVAISWISLPVYRYYPSELKLPLLAMAIEKL